jgi:hypothetical protein
MAFGTFSNLLGHTNNINIRTWTTKEWLGMIISQAEMFDNITTLELTFASDMLYNISVLKNLKNLRIANMGASEFEKATEYVR